MEKKSRKKAVFFGVGAALLVFVLAINITAGVFAEAITQYMQGSGVVFTSEGTEEALAVSDELCRDIVEESAVLVKNENDTLPLTKSELSRVNVFGWRSINNGWVGGGSGSVNANNQTTKNKITGLLQAFDANDIEYNTELTAMYEKFYNQRDGKALNDGLNYFIQSEPPKDWYTDEIINNAKAFSDIAIVVLSRLGGEGVDLPYYQRKRQANGTVVTDNSRNYLDLSTEEEDMLEIVNKNFERIIVIITNTNEMNYSFLDKYENIGACLNVSGTGQSGTYAIVRLLRGKANPSGRLASTHPYDFETDPVYPNGGTKAGGGHIVYAENIYVGYKWYETADAEGYWNDATLSLTRKMGDGSETVVEKTGYDAVVQYPFGYGLSYTDFEWEVEEFTPATTKIGTDTQFSVKVKVTNVGEKKGRDVVELYCTPPYTKGGIEKSAVNLVAYAKTGVIYPDESETVELKFTSYEMASYDDYDKNGNGFKGYELDAGNYIVTVRKDAHTVADIENATITYALEEGVKFENDPVTGKKVENRFTGDTAYAGNPIDGSGSSQEDVVYLTRNDFKGTFPKYEGARTGGTVSAAQNYVYNGDTTTEMPTTGSGEAGELLLYTKEDGTAADANQLKSGEGLKINHELMMKLGGNYDDPAWEQLLNQLSMNDMSRLVRLGGYRTVELVSVGKKYFLDNDGGSGLNRHIQESDFANPDRSNWTLFPSINLLGMSWDDRLAYAFGLALANEANQTGINGWYSPACNMQRSPFDGRNSEYVSEDSLLSGKITAYTAKGAIANGMYTYVKHFAVNESETHRGGMFTWLTEQSLREIYLRPFEIVVKEGKTQGIMSSFNRLGSTWTGGNHALMTDILRDEWGFRGATVTDYYSGGLMNFKQGLYAGQDLLLTGGGEGTAPGWGDTSDPTFVAAARRACHNILYSRCNAYYQAQTHDSSEDVVKADVTTIVGRKVEFPYWTLIIGGIDVIFVLSMVIWGLLVFCPKLFKKKAANAPSERSDKEEKA